MAPEIFKKENVKQQTPYCPFRADIYALGVMLVHMVAKQFPLEFNPGKDDKCKNFNFVSEFFHSERNIYNIKVSDDFIDLAQKLMAYKPEQRLRIEEIREHAWFKRYEKLMSGQQDKQATQKEVYRNLSRRLEYVTTLTKISIDIKKVHMAAEEEDKKEA